MQQIYRTAPMPKCDFKIKLLCNFLEIALCYGCSPVHFPNLFSKEHLWLVLSGRNLHITCLSGFWMHKLWMQCLKNAQNVRRREKYSNMEYFLVTYLNSFHSMMPRTKMLEIENIEMSSLWVLNSITTNIIGQTLGEEISLKDVFWWIDGDLI